MLVQPKGSGAASAWVARHYPAEMKALRSHASSQPNLGLLVMVDGDNVGVMARQRWLESLLTQPRQPTERAAILVPTWSVETWMC